MRKSIKIVEIFKFLCLAIIYLYEVQIRRVLSRLLSISLFQHFQISQIMTSCKFIEWARRLLGKNEIRSTSAPQITHPHLNEMPPNQRRKGGGHESVFATHPPLHKVKTKAQIHSQRSSHWRIPQSNACEVGMDAWDELVVDPDENVARRQSTLYSMTRSKLSGKAASGN
jgi:hypothetical protein